ncbi:MAG: flippase-like domain-containing protein, partial [Deltaproteobacteria bacterium]|nr:flippase-like domain-containing protein [Deltaproteobacteria bacterium]
HWFRLFMLGSFLNKALPQAGNIYRAVELKSHYRISYTHFMTAFFFFTWTDTFLNFSMASILIIATGFSMELVGIQAAYALPVLTVLVILFPFLLDMVVRCTESSGKSLSRFHKTFSNVTRSIVAVLKDAVFNGEIIGLGLIAFIPMCARVYITFLMLDIHLDLPVLVLFSALLKLSQLVNLTPGNVGIQELALGYVCQEAGVGMENGIIAALILRLLGYMLLIVCGAVLGGMGLLGEKEKYAAGFSACLSYDDRSQKPTDSEDRCRAD